jgi:OOP family OmpA-OmpF porin
VAEVQPAAEPPPPPPAPVCTPPAGFQVDANCRIIEQTVIVRDVDFEFNSSRLTAPSQHTLDQVAAALEQQPELYVEIDGHTDSIGGVAYNLRLSRQRAESVRAYLVGKGVHADTLSAHGYGKAKPLTTNNSAEGRAKNRRVEFVVANAPPHVDVQKHGASRASTEAAKLGQQPKKAELNKNHD